MSHHYEETNEPPKTKQILDSGKRQDFSTGSVRDTSDGKGRFDLLPYYSILKLAQHFEEGAKKYAANNWRKGQPLSRYFDSAMRHLSKFAMGFQDEPHLTAAIWNLVCFVETRMRIKMGLLPKELDDFPTCFMEFKDDDKI